MVDTEKHTAVHSAAPQPVIDLSIKWTVSQHLPRGPVFLGYFGYAWVPDARPV